MTAWAEAAQYLMDFISGGEPDDGAPAPKLLDWEQDQRMIVADINKVAGCEIRAPPFCALVDVSGLVCGHWRGAAGHGGGHPRKLRKEKKLDDWEKDYYRQHKAQVDLKQRYTAEELEEQERLKRLLGE